MFVEKKYRFTKNMSIIIYKILKTFKMKKMFLNPKNISM